MKITKIRILLVVAVFLIPSFTNAGCFTRDDIKFEITKSPNVKCLDVKINKTCFFIVIWEDEEYISFCFNSKRKDY